MQKSLYALHPFWIFWIGILTGALAIGLIFLYLNIQGANLENAILKSGKTPTINSYDVPTNGN